VVCCRSFAGGISYAAFLRLQQEFPFNIMKIILFLLFPLWGTAQLKPLQYEWRKISGPAEYWIHTPNSPVTKISKLVAGIYQFELKVTNSKNLFTKDTTTVTVNPFALPAALFVTAQQ
jgi:hypothetical protein